MQLINRITGTKQFKTLLHQQTLSYVIKNLLLHWTAHVQKVNFLVILKN